VIAKTIYNNTPMAQEIYQLAADGFPLAVSVGFVPLEYVTRGEGGFQQELDDCVKRGWLSVDDAPAVRCIYTKWLLLEYSDVPVPANPEALQLAISKGWISQRREKAEVNDISECNRKLIKAAHSACKEAEEAVVLAHESLKKVLESVPGADNENDDDGDEPIGGKNFSPDILRKVLAETMDEIVSAQVKASGDELLTMVARATGRHFEL
jgi:hypothetical protein